jgi:hypothetical protein
MEFNDMKDKLTDAKGQIDNLKNIDAQAELNKLKDKALDVDSHVANIKEKGTQLKEKIKELGIGGAAILILGILAQFLFSWWVIAPVAFYVGYWMFEDPKRSFAYGFGAMFLMWSIYAGFQSSANGALMTNQISNVFMNKVSGAQLIYLTGAVGGLVGGVSAWSGSLFRQLTNFPKRARV